MKIGRKGLDLRKCGIWDEPDFPDGNGPRISSREPQGFSVGPDVYLEWNGIVERVGMHGYARGNIVNENDDASGVVDMRVSSSNHLSVRRICDGGGTHTALCWLLPPDNAGCAACLEVPANDEWPWILMIRVFHTKVR